MAESWLDGNGEGKRPDQLKYPTDVLVDRESDSLIICEQGNRRVTRWSRGSGTRSGETIIDNIGCYGLAMDDEGALYVTDTEKHEVRRYRKGETSGTVVAGGNGKGAGLHQLNLPSYVCVDGESRCLRVGQQESSRDEMGEGRQRRDCRGWWTR